MDIESKSDDAGMIALKVVTVAFVGIDQVKLFVQPLAVMAPIDEAKREPLTPEKFAAEWANDIRRGSDAYGMPPRNAAPFTLSLSKLLIG